MAVIVFIGLSIDLWVAAAVCLSTGAALFSFSDEDVVEF